jgi:hypothetical protein
MEDSSHAAWERDSPLHASPTRVKPELLWSPDGSPTLSPVARAFRSSVATSFSRTQAPPRRDGVLMVLEAEALTRPHAARRSAAGAGDGRSLSETVTSEADFERVFGEHAVAPESFRPVFVNPAAVRDVYDDASTQRFIDEYKMMVRRRGAVCICTTVVLCHVWSHALHGSIAREVPSFSASVVAS